MNEQLIHWWRRVIFRWRTLKIEPTLKSPSLWNIGIPITIGRNIGNTHYSSIPKFHYAIILSKMTFRSGLKIYN